MQTKCRLNCHRDAVTDDDLCRTCADWLCRKSREPSSQIREFEKRAMLRVRRVKDIRGKDGRGPNDGSYVAHLYVLRSARARQERQKERERQKVRQIRHFPPHASH